jgi:hypothetical protein
VVDQHLRGLADPGHLLAEPRVRRRAAVAAGQAHTAGEHHGERRRAARAGAGPPAQHLDAGDRAVLQVLPEAGVDRVRPAGEAGPPRRVGRGHGHRAGGGEVADHVLDARRLRPVEQGGGERERLLRAEAVQGQRERGHQHGGGGQSAPGAGPAQRRPVLLVQARGMPDEPVAAQVVVGALAGQDRSRGQVGDALGPPAGVGLVPAPVLRVGGAVAQQRGEGSRGDGQLGGRVGDQLAPLAHQQPVAREVGDEHVETEQHVHAVVGQDREVQVEQGPAGGIGTSVIVLPADRGEGGRPVGGGDGAQVVHGRGPAVGGLDRGQHPLAPVGADDGAQHRVVADQPPPRRREHLDLGLGRASRRDDALVLGGVPGGDPAEGERGIAAHPVRLLHRGERERCHAAVVRGGGGRGVRGTVHGDRFRDGRRRHVRRDVARAHRAEERRDRQVRARRPEQQPAQPQRAERVQAEREQRDGGIDLGGIELQDVCEAVDDPGQRGGGGRCCGHGAPELSW